MGIPGSIRECKILRLMRSEKGDIAHILGPSSTKTRRFLLLHHDALSSLYWATNGSNSSIPIMIFSASGLYDPCDLCASPVFLAVYSYLKEAVQPVPVSVERL